MLLLSLIEHSKNVLSLYSDEYDDATVNTWRTEWFSTTLQNIELLKNPRKLYTTFDFVSIEITGYNLVDAPEMEFVHIGL